MCDTPRVSEEQLPWVQVTPCHPHNSMYLPRHLQHSILHPLLEGDGLGCSFDILLCSETLVSDMRHVLGLLVPGFGRPVVLCWGRMPRARGMAAYVRDGFGAFRQPKFECGCCDAGF